MILFECEYYAVLERFLLLLEKALEDGTGKKTTREFTIGV